MPGGKRTLIAASIVLPLIVMLVFILRHGETYSGWAAVENTVNCHPEKGCQPVAEVTTTHSGQLAFGYQASLNDGLVEWTRCVDELLACASTGANLNACVESSDCPGACRSELQSEADEPLTALALLEAVNLTFLQPGAFCPPPGGQP